MVSSTTMNIYSRLRIGALTVMSLLAGSMAFAQAPCDRACLADALDQYLNAVIQNDPGAANLAPGFRQTENAVVRREGTGTWQTMTGIGDADRRYFDPVSGQAAFFGVIEEGDGLGVATVRVRVAGGRLSEAEWLIAREGDAGLNGFNADGSPSGNFFDPANLAANPPSIAPVPRTERLSRDELIGITNSYFDGITTHDGSIIIAHPGCSRIENGFTVTGRPQQGGPPSDCTSGLANINIAFVAARRYPVVDVEAGVVMAIAVFMRNPGTTTRRNVFAEWFGIEDGRIRTVHSSMFYPEPHQPVPNWPPYDGNWPLPAELAPGVG
jgi:hypothetical protein